MPHNKNKQKKSSFSPSELIYPHSQAYSLTQTPSQDTINNLALKNTHTHSSYSKAEEKQVVQASRIMEKFTKNDKK